ncbi:MAG: diguanylate cyclase [Microcoleus sp. PH2017_10_PVI_O_A]|uniref:diguanylate cyclase domain-containing protein n=1 Tax=unclassified Microcoleus TaxID=2642155 RepID=UPI001DA6C07A|nr:MULTISPECIES: diguanylate cyclase [unclassified Microcoleus]TAE75994.1 MAG: diguanylate cyclase [Oscillatoriales cyanobacterium]MCC3409224.1 diguanylate cyclase [Microcoleus sp. PH2017_10_PVI_O_A]MCC3463598.1 diguanylate cyclase [Microcoleus sp. PH2017_11_PCY_U_A]MCC3481943.1 diguanylate cyclase [Microcoleus sp. PH2017_12_PCY_D_A]MCC3562919.1 diguanylate cyclase [Microcoleus sp. PH2017_27_LUM_O_A]
MSTKQAFSWSLEKIIKKLSEIARQINEFGDRERILQCAVEETRLLLQTDRVIIYRFLQHGDSVVLAESVGAEWPRILGQLIYDPCFETTWLERYSRGQTSSICDIHSGHLQACYVELLSRIQVQANLVVPILLDGKQQQSPKLWGLLIAHQCSSPRQWEPLEVQILQHVAVQLGLRMRQLESQHPVLAPNQPLQLETAPDRTDRNTSSAPRVNHHNCLQPEFAYSPIGDIVHLRAFDLLQNPIWIFDIEHLQMWWANQASLYLWNASTREELDRRNFSDVSESTRIRLQSYLQQFEQGKTLSEQWTFYPGGLPVSVRCRCSGIRIDSGRLAMLVEARLETHQIEPETLRSIEALRHTTLMVSLYTLEGVPLLQNPAALRCYGDALHPRSATDNVFLRHFVDPPVGERAMAVLKSGEVFSAEAQVMTLAGIRWHGMDVRCINDPVTGNLMLLVNEKDITDRQETETALQQSETRLSEAQRVAHIGNWEFDVITGKITWSPELFEILGRSRALGEPTYEENLRLYHPESAEQLHLVVQRALTRGEPYRLRLKIWPGNGSIRYTESRGQAELNAGGQVVRLFGTSQDITDLVLAETELREMSTALANAVDGISRVDIWGRYISVNQAYANIAGYQPEEMVGMNWEKTVHPEDLEMLLAACEEMLADGRVEVEVRGIRKDGSIFYKQLVMVTACDDRGRSIGHHCFMKDITDRKQAEASLKQEFQRLAVVIATQQEIALRNPNLDAVMAVIADRTQKLSGAGGVVIEMVEGEELVYRAARGIAEACVGLRLKVATSLSGQCIITGSILHCNDTELDPRIDMIRWRRIGVRSMVAVPLFYQDDRVGVLKVLSATPRAFTDSDIQTLQLMAGFLAGSLHLAEEFDAKNLLLSQLQESEERYRSVIASMTEGVVLQLADGQITACNASAERILGLTPEQMMGRTSVDLDWRTVREDGQPFPGLQHPAMLALRTGQGQSNVVMGIHKPDKTLTWISINSQPLFHLNESLPYAVVTTFADITERKLAEEILRNRAEQERLIATTDGLTQVANRRCFDERLQLEWHRLMQGKQQLSLIMLDVDYFKRYNDRYGHQAGDTCLVKVASSAAAAVKRCTDLFVRYGGEEFAALLPNTDAAGAIAVAESIRDAIRDLAIPHEQSDVSSIVTVSMGIASIVPCCETSPLELIASADRALYDAKRQGRDRLCPEAPTRGRRQRTAPDVK